MGLDKPLSDYETVKTWQGGLKEHWGEEPDMAARHKTLEQFCLFANTDPDKMIADCTREVESGKRIRIKARREYNEKIAEFQELADGMARQRGKLGNVVRSFFIHNGIFMQADLPQ
jgi:hypothetical protein